MKVTVTRDDIRRGRRIDPGHCAIALAMKRQGVEAIVGPTTIYVYDGHKQRGEYDTPPAARRFVLAFDSRPRMWPFVRPMTFELAGI